MSQGAAMQAIHDRHPLYVSLFLLLLVTAILLPRSPLQQSVPPRDSGVFLYIGQQILHGQIPYRDVWDHKGPVIYYLNALGLILGRGSHWGVWWLQWLSLGLAALLGYITLKQAFGNLPALAASTMWVTSLVFVLGGGNYTEEYGLLLQFAAVFLFWNSLGSRRLLRRAFALGLVFAAAFWLRPNLIGVPLSIFLVAVVLLFFSPQKRKAPAWILAFSAGALTFSLPVLAYFLWRGAGRDFMDAVLRYNMIYASAAPEDRADMIMEGVQLLTGSGIVFTALAGWLVGCFVFLSRPRQGGAHLPLLYVALAGLPLDVFLVSASGRAYRHYYTTWLPVFAILTAQLLFDVLGRFQTVETPSPRCKSDPRLVWTLALVVAFMFPFHRDVLDPLIEIVREGPPPTPLTVYRIWSYTNQDDYLLMWGAETSYNFLSNRRAPSRFVYQYPLLTCGYATDAMVEEFLADIERNKPLIVDTSSTNKYVPPMDPATRADWDGPAFAGSDCDPTARLEKVFEFFDSHYRKAEVLLAKGWVIYQYDETGQSRLPFPRNSDRLWPNRRAEDRGSGRKAQALQEMPAGCR